MSHGLTNPVPDMDALRSVRSRRSARLGLAAFALILILATIAIPLLGFASEGRTDGTVVVEPNEIVDDDLYAAAGEFSLDGSALGDVFAAAGTIDIPGSVGGSLNVTGGSISIDGNVGGSVRVFGGDTVVSGEITGDLMVFGGAVLIGDSATVDGDLLVYGGQVDVQGTIGGDVDGTVGLMTIDGTVGGDVDLDVQTLTVTSQAAINGSLDYVSRQDANIAQDADISGAVEHVELSPWGTGDGLRAQLFSPLIRTLWLLAAGVVMIALAPRLAAAVGGNVRRPWIPAIVGLVSMVLLPTIAILLMVSVIGIPVGVILLALFLISLYLSQVVVGQRIGTLLLPRSWNDGSRGFLLLSMTFGVILISAFRFVPLPFVSTAVNLLVAIIGLGAMVLLVRQLRPGYIVHQR